MDRRRKTLNSYDTLAIASGVHLTLAGFTRASPEAVQTTVKTIDALPAAHLRDLHHVVYDPEHNSVDDPAVHPGTKGLYLQTSRDVVIFGFDDSDELRHILCHEIGHHVFSYIIDSEARVDWTTQTHRCGGHVSSYSERNAVEDFAECYAAFILHPKRLETFTRKYVFMRDRVFYGIAVNLNELHIDYLV